MAEIDKQIIVKGLKHYHDCSFTPGVYEHSIIGQAALLLEKSEEVVRCKDCKHYKKDSLSCAMNSKDRGEWFNWYEDDFCSYGERRDGE